ncbi:hypothetical protein F5Y16DRAFT_392527 [Xylariaceae sp. FL0255]|nr:hypothetical protein F5Y16DRAFT_392527 [Xylariaceae sp. FL0255]
MITNLDIYAQKNPGVAFIIIHEYTCCLQRKDSGNVRGNPDIGSSSPDMMSKQGESLFVASQTLSGALSTLKSVHSVDCEWMPSHNVFDQSKNWEIWAFHNLDAIRTLPGLCVGIYKEPASLFTEYFCNLKAQEFNTIRHLIDQSYFTRRSLPYLFIPDSVCVAVSNKEAAYHEGFTLTDWPVLQNIWALSKDSSEKSTIDTRIWIDCKLKSWSFDGNYMRTPKQRNFSIDIATRGNPISSLLIIPVKYMTTKQQDDLRARGENHWKCRKMRYVTYHGWDFDRMEYFDHPRFMIDIATSKNFYRFNTKNPKEPLPELEDHLGATRMAGLGVPDDAFLMTTPLFVWGFHMDRKSWKKLAVAHVDDVDWDQQAFDNLVIDPDSKDVIQSLVATKVQNSATTDLIRGKGNGIILLLHGPPGTGKTLTAESVAEHAKKPLYRVTCGDIGTKPETVEQYLQKVLLLGKAWDCVILLDEAEVFLQERSLEDLERNALVSVFLRQLEYYDGILILTSNRVGTFDEGFRSRIQLAIHYPKLEQPERRRVWELFVNRLNNDPLAAQDIDVRNLRSNLTELSRFNLNGREIRNAINVARPLAKSEGKLVDFDALKKVVRVQQKFEGYVKDMNEGLDDEKVAREIGKR